MQLERFNVDDYLRCDCASVANQTCDKCAVRGHIDALQRFASEAKYLIHVALDTLSPDGLTLNVSQHTILRMALLMSRNTPSPAPPPSNDPNREVE